MDRDMQQCEICPTTLPVEDMISMPDHWLCPSCAERANAAFRACSHEWRADTDDCGQPAHVCRICSHIVTDEDFPAVFGCAAPERHEPVPVSGIHLVRLGDYVIVKAEIDGTWVEVIREHHDGSFSHIVEPLGMRRRQSDQVVGATSYGVKQ